MKDIYELGLHAYKVDVEDLADHGQHHVEEDVHGATIPGGLWDGAGVVGLSLYTQRSLAVLTIFNSAHF